MTPRGILLPFAGCLPLLGACATQESAESPPPEVNAGLELLLSQNQVSGRPTDLAGVFARDAEALAALQGPQSSDREMVDGDGSPTTTDAGSAPAEANPQPTIEVADLDPAPSVSIAQGPEQAGEESAQTAAQITEVTESLSQRRARLVAELGAALREELRAGANPVRTHAALSALGAIDPDSVDVALTDPGLSDREVAALRAWRTMMRHSAEWLVGSEGDASALVDAVEQAAGALASWKPVEIAGAALCARVEGYGRYTELPTRLLAGRNHPAIVYVELERFGVEPGVGDDREPGYVSRVTMELSLYHDADGLLAWRSAAREVKDFSRRQRRDFFLVQRVDLPSTLTVGVYRLKITVRDRITGSEAERIIPIDVVADAALIRAER